jgi:uncharacterized protein (TIGR02118 family)
MFKMVILYRRADDEPAVDAFFSQVNLPLAERLPGLVKSEVSRVTGKPGGQSRYYLMYELYFDSLETFATALISPAGKELMPQLLAWTEARLITWFYAESYEGEMAAPA